ncbi:MAG: L-2-amino-thiazoline-4-carboxylic acid hydrolase [Dehalococcoidia bacterium]|nr:L-2-amino-thiazoline-4-carboxylic acid hydrolase [Dehalococcoidia bacterium]
MVKLNDKQIIEFWHRSYRTVDGLWFVKIEERYGFDTALDIDNEVWTVFSKIQARMIKSLGELKAGLDGLLEAIETRLDIEGYKFEVKRAVDGTGFDVIISECPWHKIMIASGREHLSGKVGTLICNSEYSIWASEFGDDIRFEMNEQICEGCDSCILRFISIPSHKT